MANDSAEVKLGADSAALQSGMQAAADSVKQSTQNMASSLSKMSTDAKVKTQETVDHFKTMADGIKQAFALIGGVAILGTLKSMVETFAGVAEQLEHVSQKTGMTTEFLQGLKFSGDLVGVSFEGVTRSMRGLVMAMSAAEAGNEKEVAAFKQVGLSVADLKSMSPEQVILKIADAFEKAAPGTTKMQEAIDLFKRTGLDLIPLLNLGSKGITELNQAAKDLGLTMSGPEVEALARTGIELKIVNAQHEAMKRQFVEQLIPAIEQVIGAFQSLRGQGEGVQTFGAAVGDVFQTIARVAGNVWLALKDMGDGLGALFAQGAALARADMAGFKAIGDARAAQAAKNESEFNAFNARMVKGATDTADKLKNIAQTVLDAGKKTGGTPFTSNAAAVKAPDTSELDTQIALQAKGVEMLKEVLKGEVDAKRMTALEADAITRDAQQREYEAVRALMEKKKALYKADSTEYKNMMKQMELYDADFTIKQQANTNQAATDQRKAADEIMKLQQDALKHKIAMLDEGEKLDKSALDQQVAQGKITAEQRLAIERDHLNSLYDAKKKLLDDEAALIDPTLHPKDLLDIYQQIEKLDADHQTKLQENSTKTTELIAKQWGDILSVMTNAIETSVKGIILGTTTLQKALSNIYTAILGEFVNLCAKMVMEWAKAQLTMKMQAAGMNGIGGIFSMFFSGGGAGITAADTASSGGAGLADLVAAGGVSFAVGTNYVPRDMIAQLHEGEQIVPKAYNPFITGSGTGRGVQQYNTFVVPAPTDMRSQTQIAAAVAAAANQALRSVG